MAKKTTDKSSKKLLGYTEYREGNVPFPIVGIGASAGGLSAFEAFFSAMPKGSNMDMAFVLVQHLAPDRKSILSEIIQRYTTMKVLEVIDGVSVEMNTVYIISPSHDMALMNGKLQLLEPSVPHGFRLPIDFFFRSLAQDQEERAIGIILSGTGSDGVQGVRAIKAAEGMVMAQKRSSCEYEGMPRSAIETGFVDYELLPSEMPAKLIEYVKSISKRPTSATTLSDENALIKIFILLRNQTGHDFSQYKPSTINRRIERRMVLNQFATIDSYIKYMQQTPSEIEALFYELLIGVTNFFRDNDAFKSLELVLPKIFSGKKMGDTIRVWSVGCSTGEEAYSLAILLYEYMQEIKQNFPVQIFATDIDPHAIAIARAGVYPSGIATDISAKRIAHFFTFDSDSQKYRINKNIRDMLIFSEQNVIKDPPFSKLDLVVCRNLLIYMNADLQKRVIPTFHYALKEGGILFLGSSETIGEYGNLFITIDHKTKIYESKNASRGVYRMASHVAETTQSLPPQSVEKLVVPTKIPFKELTEQTLLEQIAPSAILVNNKGDILYLYANAGKYLELPSGEICVNNILRMTKNSLQRALTISLHKATETNETVRSGAIKVKTKDKYSILNLIITPVHASPDSLSKPTMYLIILEELPMSAEKGLMNLDALQSSDVNTHIVRLTRELETQEEYLKTSNEKLGISNEELRSSNEEIQSMNEELQSSNEELETSKEELQSVNEELSTVNAELQMKVIDLSRSNNDMNNLLAGTGIGTVFVDHNLCILRFTPAASRIINLISGDIGRPVNHIVSNMLGYNKLREDLKEVLGNLIPKEIEVKTIDEKYYIMRIQPYRTLENVIEGAVITFIETTKILQMREELKRANRELLRMAAIVRDSNDAIILQDFEGKILAWNPAATAIYGWSEEEALGLNIEQMIPDSDKKEAFQTVENLSKSKVLKSYTASRIAKGGEEVDVSITASVLVNEEKKPYAIVTTQRKINLKVSENMEADNV
ncbi:MAG: chemotaxis protein CheB [Sulfurimonas sp.]|jgi:two-component system CheB/CheR fusion protein